MYSQTTPKLVGAAAKLICIPIYSLKVVILQSARSFMYSIGDSNKNVYTIRQFTSMLSWSLHQNLCHVIGNFLYQYVANITYCYKFS